MKNQPYQTQVLEDPEVKQKSAELSIINRMRPKEHNEAQINENLSEEDSGVDVVDQKVSKIQTDGRYKSLKHYHLFCVIQNI